MFEIRLRTAPEIEMCPVVSTQSKQRAAQCEESWELSAAAAEKFTAGRWRGRRRIGQHLLCTTAPSTQLRLAPHYLQNCMLVSTALIPHIVTIDCLGQTPLSLSQTESLSCRYNSPLFKFNSSKKLSKIRSMPLQITAMLLRSGWSDLMVFFLQMLNMDSSVNWFEWVRL